MQWRHTQTLHGKTSMSTLLTIMLTCHSTNACFDVYDNDVQDHERFNGVIDASDFIVDIREYDVPYHVRVAIDKSEH